MRENPQQPTLSDLDARLLAIQERQKADEVRRFHRRLILPKGTLEFSSRVFNDLIAAVLISISIGAAIDAAFDSWPWGTLGLFLLGAAAAVRNVYQTANKMADTEAPAGLDARPTTTRG
jgi:F0F1-type ATP synthase assembly protein I